MWWAIGIAVVWVAGTLLGFFILGATRVDSEYDHVDSEDIAGIIFWPVVLVLCILTMPIWIAIFLGEYAYKLGRKSGAKKE